MLLQISTSTSVDHISIAYFRMISRRAKSANVDVVLVDYETVLLSHRSYIVKWIFLVIFYFDSWTKPNNIGLPDHQ